VTAFKRAAELIPACGLAFGGVSLRRFGVALGLILFLVVLVFIIFLAMFCSDRGDGCKLVDPGLRAK
jgi:hypothetical protein